MAKISFSGRHFQRDMILQSVRWHLTYALSYRDIGEILQKRGFDVDHSTIHRWVVHYSPQLVQKFRSIKLKPAGRWRLDETYIKVKGKWKYYYRAVDKYGETVDFLLTAKRDTKAALRYLRKAIGSCGNPSLINIDRSRKEAVALETLDHPGIPILYESNSDKYKDDDKLYLVSEPVPGTTLAQKVSDGLLSFNESICMTQELAQNKLLPFNGRGSSRHRTRQYYS